MSSTRLRRLLGPLLAALFFAGALPASAQPSPTRLINVVQVTWPGARPKATTDDLVRVIRDDTIARWQRISNGSVHFTFDSELPPVTMRAPLPCDASGSSAFMNEAALLAFQGAGIQQWDNRYLILLAADPGGCIWAGQGAVNPPGSTSGLLVLKDTVDAMVVAHELGHNLGLGHSNLETCTGGRDDGPWSDCSAVEYGSATDLMSNNDRTSVLAAYHQWRLGIIPDTAVALADVSKTVLLHPVDTTTGTRALFLRDGSAAYWVEYRRNDPENGIREGLVVYRSDPPPESSVVDPAGNSNAVVLNGGIPTDVWMIDLGDYRYGYPATGSPSLGSGLPFTTAFGAITIAGVPTGDGTVRVTVTRRTNPAPAAPTWTPRSEWRGMDSQLTRSDLDDGGVPVAYFEARITTDTGSSVRRIEATLVPSARRTYLAPISTPVAVMASALPEGVYGLELRAVNAAGVAGPWSVLTQVAIDLGDPVVDGRFTVDAAQPGSTVRVRWTGARDAGAGVCSARGYDAEGFALLRWDADEAGTAGFTLPASGSSNYDAHVADCFGNRVRGQLSLATAWVPGSGFSRQGAWSRGSAPRCTTGTCTATLRSSAGSLAIVVGAGSGSVLVDGRRVAAIAPSTRSTPRVVARVAGAHRVQVRGNGLTLFGAQALRTEWQPQDDAPVTTPVSDPSLSDDIQWQLSQLGFSQQDFVDGLSVLPLQGGTTTEQATLDLCSAQFPSEADRRERRQVVVTRGAGDPYVFLSTETVRYWSSESVRKALAEIDAAATLCRTRGYALATDGTRETYTFQALPTLPSGLRPAGDRRLFLLTMGEGDAARTALIAYQFRGRTLNALYVVRKGADSLEPERVAGWLRVAAVLAGRLTTDI